MVYYNKAAWRLQHKKHKGIPSVFSEGIWLFVADVFVVDFVFAGVFFCVAAVGTVDDKLGGTGRKSKSADIFCVGGDDYCFQIGRASCRERV